MAVPLDQPALVVGQAELLQGGLEFIDGVEDAHPEQILLQRPDEALGAAIAFRRPDEGWR